MKSAIVGFIALLLVGVAHAEPYVLLGAGYAKTDAAGFKESTVPVFGGLGYSFNKVVAIEGVLADFDSARSQERVVRTSTGGGSSDLTVSNTRTEWKGRGAGLFVAGFYPVSQATSVVGRLGAYRVTSKTSTSNETVVFSATPGVDPVITRSSGSASESKWAPSFGGGLQYKATEKVAFRGLLEQVNGSGDFKRARAFTFSLMYSFGG